MRKKILAIGISGLLTAGLLVGSLEYASHSFAVEHGVAQAAQKQTEETVGTKESGGTDTDEVSKQETVYVNLDAQGNTTNVIVSDWLKNSGANGTLKDSSRLTDIQNVKGEETFSQEGEDLTWETSDQDIYYQGTTDEEIPVGIEIRYLLDGEEISPEELAGKSGKLEMRIRYTNRASRKVSINGKATDIYVPFMMVTGMMLPTEHFTNMKIDHGTIVSEGDNTIVMAYGMPGLEESLALDQLDFGEDMDIDTSKIRDKITDTVTIKGDVTDFEMQTTYTVATNQIFNELDFDDLDDVNELSDKIDDLKDASSQLVDGTKSLKEGTQSLKKRFSEYRDAVKTAGNGAKELHSGAKTLKNGVVSYTQGSDKLLIGVGDYVKGAKTLSQGVQSYTQGADQLVAAVSQLRTATADLPAQYATLGNGIDAYVNSVNQLLSKDNMNQMAAGTSALKNGIGELDNGLKAAKSGVDTINGYAKQLKQTEELDACVSALNAMISQYTAAAKQYEEAGDSQNAGQYTQMASALTGAVAYIQGGEQIAAGIDAVTNGTADGEADSEGAKDLAVALATMQAATDKESSQSNLYTGAAALESSVNTMSGYAEQVRGSSESLTAGNAQMSSALTSLSSSIAQLDGAAGKLTANNEALNSGAASLIENGKTITANAGKLKKNSPSLRKGAKQLEQGTGTLFAGMTKLLSATDKVSNGISKINDGAQELKSGMVEFDQEGIRKLADSVTDLLDQTDDLNTRLSRISSTSEDYTSFSGNAKGMEGSVKFILATEEIGSKDGD